MVSIWQLKEVLNEYLRHESEVKGTPPKILNTTEVAKILNSGPSPGMFGPNALNAIQVTKEGKFQTLFLYESYGSYGSYGSNISMFQCCRQSSPLAFSE